VKNAVSTHNGMKHFLYFTHLHLTLNNAGAKSPDKLDFTFTRTPHSEHLRMWKPPDSFSKLFSKTGKNFLAKTSIGFQWELL